MTINNKRTLKYHCVVQKLDEGIKRGEDIDRQCQQGLGEPDTADRGNGLSDTRNQHITFPLGEECGWLTGCPSHVDIYNCVSC